MQAFDPSAYAGRKVLVTGGSSGIGLGIAKGFLRHGAEVHILGRSQEKLDAVREQPEGTLHGHSADVRDVDALQALAKELGTLDVLVNGAAGNFPVPFSLMSDNAWNSVIDIVLQGTVHTTRAFGQPMWDANDGQDRAILNIVAGYAWTGAPGVSHSGAAKAGVLNLSKSLAVEWAPRVRVNCVSPGPIGGTEGMKRLAEDLGLGDAVVRGIPAARMGTADDVAQASLFLCHPAASFVTGVVLPVDGGQDAVGPFGALFQGLSD